MTSPHIAYVNGQVAAGSGTPSKLNCPGSVPATPLTLTITDVCAVEPPYAGGAHETVVADLQAVLVHIPATASVAVGVKANPPKLRPLIVTDPPAVSPTFGGLLTLTQGAGTPTEVGHACHRMQLASCPQSSYHRS